MDKNKEVVWGDLGYTVKFNKGSDHFVDFKAYKIKGNSLLSETDIFLHGHIKYTGCSEIEVDALDISSLHFCKKQEMIDIGVLLGKIYDEAFKLMPEYSE